MAARQVITMITTEKSTRRSRDHAFTPATMLFFFVPVAARGFFGSDHLERAKMPANGGLFDRAQE